MLDSRAVNEMNTGLRRLELIRPRLDLLVPTPGTTFPPVQFLPSRSADCASALPQVLANQLPFVRPAAHGRWQVASNGGPVALARASIAPELWPKVRIPCVAWGAEAPGVLSHEDAALVAAISMGLLTNAGERRARRGLKTRLGLRFRRFAMEALDYLSR